MFPNPRLGMPTASGEPEKSVYLADPHVAHLEGVKAALAAASKPIAARAAGRLMTVKALSDRSAGPMGSRIQVMDGVIDYYVVLDDQRSDFAAAKIEKDHGILSSATPVGREALAYDDKYVRAAEGKLRRPPRGLEVDSEPS